MAAPANNLASVKVLVVEDEPLIAMDYADWLAEAGASVVGPCARVSDALRMLEEDGVDVAIVDYALADGNSEPVQAALVARAVPFIVVTAYPRVLVRRRDGNEMIYYKPVTGDLLRAAVADALGAGAGGAA